LTAVARTDEGGATVWQGVGELDLGSAEIVGFDQDPRFVIDDV